MYRVFPHFEKEKKRLGNFTPYIFYTTYRVLEMRWMWVLYILEPCM